MVTFDLHVQIPYELVERRPGDVASCYGDPSLATKELHWTAKKGLDEMCECFICHRLPPVEPVVLYLGLVCIWMYTCVSVCGREGVGVEVYV